MLEADKPVFLQTSDESDKRVLHSGKTVRVEGNKYTCAFDRDEALSCQENDAVFIYFQDGRTFMQQRTLICSISEAESKVEITLEATSDPVSAESRECYRVSTVLPGLTIAVADDRDCPLLDVSASGMAASLTSHHKVGDEVLATLSYEGREYTGKVIVQNVTELGGGRIRYGLHCVQDRRCGGNLGQGLQVVSVSIQRLLIQRLVRN